MSGYEKRKKQPVEIVEERAGKTADEMGLELVEVTLEKESRGKCLCVYVDKIGGISLDDCENYHKKLQPLLDDIEYDIMEVSSPGIDRPIKTERDFERNRNNVVEVKLFAPLNGTKTFRGILKDMTDEKYMILLENQTTLEIDRKKTAIVKPVIDLEDEDFEDVDFSEETAEEIEL